MISNHGEAISDLVAQIRSPGGAIILPGTAISCLGGDVRVLGTMISKTVARITWPGGPISALASRVERVCGGHLARFVCARKSVKPSAAFFCTTLKQRAAEPAELFLTRDSAFSAALHCRS